MTTGEAASPALPPLIVCLGTSAGGLRALEAFFRHMPVESGCSFVVVQTPSPDSRAPIDALLARWTKLRIRPAEPELPIVRDTIHLIPAEKMMTVGEGRLQLTECPTDLPVDLPLNTFLASLARDAGPRAVAILLSGSGTAGIAGVRAVHAAGGLVIVQDPATAGCEGMPAGADATGLADHILAPEVMPQAVLAYRRDPTSRGLLPAADPLSSPGGQALPQRIAELELQLAAAKKTLQVTRAELQAVNVECERRSVELDRTIADLDNVFAASDAGTLIFDGELRIRRFNPSIQALFNLLPTDIGRPVEHLARQLADEAQLVAETRRVLETGRSIEGEVRTRDGRWLLKRILPFRGARQPIEGVVLTLTPLDARNGMQAKLDLAMVSLRLVWWEWDLVRDVLETHASGWCLLGYEVVWLVPSARSWFELTHPEDLARVRRTLEECLRGERAEWECEHRLRARDGSWRWVLNKGRASERDRDGRPSRMLGTTQDIHAKKQAELELEKLSLAIQHSLASVVIADASGQIEYVNQAFTRVTGYAAHEVIGRNPRVLNSGHHPKSFFAAMWASLLRGESWQGEMLNRKRDGTLFWERASISAVRNDNGSITHFVAVKEDITQQKAEEKKRELLERQLAQAQKMETLGTLAGGIAHDFNNLLTGILGYSQNARMTLPEDHEAVACLDVVDETSRRAAELVRRILAFSRHHFPSHAPVVLADAVHQIFPVLRSSVPTSIELILQDSSGGATIMGDTAQLGQLVVNLCTNAAQAIGSQQGAIRIEISVAEIHSPQSFDVGSVDPGLFLKLSVADTGEGIDEGVRGRIFEPFFTTKGPGEGTGLGLAIVHTTVTAHHGAIEVRSRKGSGTTFSVYLPISESHAAPPPGMLLPDGPVAARAPALADVPVFIIDDEEFIAKLTAKVFKAAGAVPTVFTSASECLAALRADPRFAGVIITDQTMPGMAGVEFVEAIRALGMTVPVIIVSGYAGAIDPPTIRRLEPCRFLAKPFEVVTLLHAAASVVGVSGPGDGPVPDATG